MEIHLGGFKAKKPQSNPGGPQAENDSFKWSGIPGKCIVYLAGQKSQIGRTVDLENWIWAAMV